jgi:hypothetical protein
MAAWIDRGDEAWRGIGWITIQRHVC